MPGTVPVHSGFTLIECVLRQPMGIECVRQNQGGKLECKPGFLRFTAKFFVYRNRLIPAHTVLGDQYVRDVVIHVSPFNVFRDLVL